MSATSGSSLRSNVTGVSRSIAVSAIAASLAEHRLAAGDEQAAAALLDPARRAPPSTRRGIAARHVAQDDDVPRVRAPRRVAGSAGGGADGHVEAGLARARRRDTARSPACLRRRAPAADGRTDSAAVERVVGRERIARVDRRGRLEARRRPASRASTSSGTLVDAWQPAVIARWPASPARTRSSTTAAAAALAADLDGVRLNGRTGGDRGSGSSTRIDPGVAERAAASGSTDTGMPLAASSRRSRPPVSPAVARRRVNRTIRGTWPGASSARAASSAASRSVPRAIDRRRPAGRRARSCASCRSAVGVRRAPAAVRAEGDDRASARAAASAFSSSIFRAAASIAALATLCDTSTT